MQSLGKKNNYQLIFTLALLTSTYMPSLLDFHLCKWKSSLVTSPLSLLFIMATSVVSYFAWD